MLHLAIAKKYNITHPLTNVAFGYYQKYNINPPKFYTTQTQHKQPPNKCCIWSFPKVQHNPPPNKCCIRLLPKVQHNPQNFTQHKHNTNNPLTNVAFGYYQKYNITHPLTNVAFGYYQKYNITP